MARKSSISKEKIIETALECFVEYGFEETTFQQIAQKLKVSQPSLYTYFKNKMDLLAGASLWAAQKGRIFIDGQVNPKAHAIERLNQYLSANFQYFRKNPHEAFAVSAIYFFAQSDNVLLETYRQIQQLSVERFEANLLQISYEKGKKISNSLPLAETIQSIMIGEIFKLINKKSQKHSLEREAALLLQINSLIEISLH